MKNAIPMLIIVLLSVLIFIVDDLIRKRRLLRFWRRPCMGSDWRRNYPSASKGDIRAFLDVFVEAFMFKRKNRLKFSPNDKLIDVYRTVYTPSSAVDAMELETFTLTLKRKYGTDLTQVKNLENITLGEVFALTRRSPASR